MISEHLRELINCWLMWMKNNRIACDPTRHDSERAEAARMCEDLMGHRGEIIEEIDKVFDGVTDQRD